VLDDVVDAISLEHGTIPVSVRDIGVTARSRGARSVQWVAMGDTPAQRRQRAGGAVCDVLGERQLLRRTSVMVEKSASGHERHLERS
jgi:hypothetical protein